jgi:hypothetical protein
MFLENRLVSHKYGKCLNEPDDSEESKEAMALLAAGQVNDFEKAMSGAGLSLVRFGSRRCEGRETHFHSFIGEAAAGRWGISKNKKYLYGRYFFWLVDCNALRIFFIMLDQYGRFVGGPKSYSYITFLFCTHQLK